MTIQIPDVLEREDAAPTLPKLHLYGVRVGEINAPRAHSESYPFKHRGDRSKITPYTALWRGYVSVFRLRTDGTLALVRIVYPFTADVADDVVDEILTGHFWLTLRPSFFADGIRIPFRDGRVVTDTTRWHPSNAG